MHLSEDMKEDYPTMPTSDVSLINESRNRLIFDEMNYNCRLHLSCYIGTYMWEENIHAATRYVQVIVAYKECYC